MWKYILLFMVSCLTTDTIQSQTYYSEFIQNLDSMKNTGLRRTKKDNSEDYYIPEEAVKNYIKLFNQLQCTRKNATVQCFYKCDRYGGRPVLVASSQDVNQLYKHKKLTPEWLYQNAAHHYMVPVNSSPMALFQYLVFNEYGEQFALYWHALYTKRRILLKHPYRNPKSRKIRLYTNSILNQELNSEALDKGIEPVVTMDENHCFITLFEENHTNIKQVKYRIERKYPWSITLLEEKPMIKKSQIIY